MLLFEPTPALCSTDDWYTPPQYLEAARSVMGGIDIDPASHVLAQEAVKAARYFTKETNGLQQPWHGRVWLNPPYSMPAIQQFIVKLLNEHQEGHVEQAICLVNNATDTGWFHAMIDRAIAVCLTKGRIRFYSPIRTGESPRQGQAFFYFGNDLDRFTEKFSPFGAILPCTKKPALVKRVFLP